MKEKLSFLTSNRFWILVIASLGVSAEGNFTKEAWIRALIAFASGFIGIRTVDRFSETLSEVK